MSYVRWIRDRLGHRKVILAYSTVIAHDDRGRVLLQRRADLPVWGFPGGVLEFGEDFETCARRELAEETGLEVGPLGLVGLYTSPRHDVAYPNGDAAQQFTVCLTGRVSGGTMAVDRDEALEQRFFAPAAAPRAEMTSWYAQMLDDLRRPSPACDVPEPTAGPGPTMTELLPDASGLIVPMVLLMATLPDGRILARQTSQGLRLPAAALRLGETATAAAAGLLGSGVNPSLRFAGVLSRRELTAGLGAHPGQHPVAALFQTELLTGLPSGLLPVRPAELIAAGGPASAALHRLLVALETDPFLG